MNYSDLKELYVNKYHRFSDVKLFNKFIWGLLLHVIFTEFALVALTSVTVGLWLSVITVVLSMYLMLTAPPRGCDDDVTFRKLSWYSKLWVLGVIEFVLVFVLIYFLRYV